MAKITVVRTVEFENMKDYHDFMVQETGGRIASMITQRPPTPVALAEEARETAVEHVAAHPVAHQEVTADAPPAEEKRPVGRPVGSTKKAPAKAPEKTEAPGYVAASVTKAEALGALKALFDHVGGGAKGVEATREILGKFGVTQFGELDAKHYSQMAQHCNEAKA